VGRGGEEGQGSGKRVSGFRFGRIVEGGAPSPPQEKGGGARILMKNFWERTRVVNKQKKGE
jgi:hypothetical protein